MAPGGTYRAKHMQGRGTVGRHDEGPGRIVRRDQR